MVIRKTKKIASGLLAIIMFLSLSAVFCFDKAYAEYDGEWQYTVESGTATITGYIGTGTTVTVPAKVGGVAVKAVTGLNTNSSKTKVTAITLSSGIKEIGSAAFSGYTALTKVSLPDTLTTIGSNAFYNCTSLTSVTLPTAVTSIGDGAFSNCTALLTAKLACQARSLPAKLFENCKKLSVVTLPTYLTSIGDSAFSGCSILKTLSIPDTVTSIGTSAFTDCAALNTITLPSSLKTIGEMAFQNCTSLTSVFIPNNTKTIGEDAFKGCSSLTALYISPSVNVIKANAFSNCNKLEKVVFGGEYVNISNAFGTSTSAKVYYPSKYASSWSAFSSTLKESYTATTAVTVSGTTKIAPGKKSTLKITISPSSCPFNDVYSIYSSNTAVATVSSDGAVTAKTPGTATVTVTSVNGTSKSIAITVQPAAPEDLKITPKSTSSVDLSWTASTGATGYYIYRSTSKNGKYTKVATVLSPSYTDKGLTKGSTYYYLVMAYVNSSGSVIKSEYSDIVSVTATSPAPTSVTATKAKSGSATIKWSKCAGAAGYEIYMKLSTASKYTKVATITNASTLTYTKTGLTAGKTYYVTIRSYITVNGTKKYSPYSKVVSVKV